MIGNQDMPGLVTTDECIAAMEQAYTEFGTGTAQELPRRRIYHAREQPADHYYWFNEMAGIVPGIHTMAIRLNSATVNVSRKRGNARFGFPGAFSALVLLFDTRTNRLLGVLQDFYMNPIRVAATSAIVTRRLARDDARVMGLFGSGTQAILQAEYNCAVTALDEIRVYSTRKERREDIARRMSAGVGVRAVAVDHPREAVEGCDIVTTATSSNEPVFRGEWLEAGAHLNTMIGSDYFLPRRETDDETVLRSDIIVVNSRTSVRLDKQPELYPPPPARHARMGRHPRGGGPAREAEHSRPLDRKPDHLPQQQRRHGHPVRGTRPAHLREGAGARARHGAGFPILHAVRRGSPGNSRLGVSRRAVTDR